MYALLEEMPQEVIDQLTQTVNSCDTPLFSV